MQEPVTNSTPAEWVDPDDAPDWTSDVFDIAEVRQGDRVLKPASGVLKRGRPKLDAPKVRVTLRLDADLIDILRSGGSGWQTRVNSTLRKASGL